MADILIRGMEMPKHDDDYVIFTVYGDGGVVYGPLNRPHVRYKHRATPLPEGHGRLIDADALMEYFTSDSYWLSKLHKTQDGFDKETWTNEELRHLINKAPTIVPAEGGGEDENR